MNKDLSKSKRTDLTDKFYTKSSVAKNLLDEINLDEYENIIEPSAGKGGFSSQINGCIALDIDPKSEGIIERNFFEFEFGGNRKDTLIIGNPPFGRQGSKALRFIEKAATLADTIAFILPKSFKKSSMKRKIPETYHLIKEVDLRENIFLYKGESYSVPSVFQVWKNRYFKRRGRNKSDPVGFLYVERKDKADLAVRRVGVYAGDFYLETDDKSSESHYFLKLLVDLSPEELVKDSRNFTFDFVNYTTGPNSLSKDELNNVLYTYFEENGLVKSPEFW